MAGTNRSVIAVRRMRTRLAPSRARAVVTAAPPAAARVWLSSSRPNATAIAPAVSTDRWTEAARRDGAGEEDQVTASSCVAPEMALRSPPTRNRCRGSHSPVACGTSTASGAAMVNAAAATRLRRA